MSPMTSSARIFGIGLSRTGTSSLTRALEMVGFRSVHFPADPTTQREILRFFARPTERLELSLLREIDAIVDTPVCCVYPALDLAYPGSKFVMTVREKESWLDSCARYWRIPKEARLREFIQSIDTRLYGRADFDRKAFAATYDEYHARVAHYFRDRPADLLRLNVCAGEGWTSLAPFVGASVPTEPFPSEP